MSAPAPLAEKDVTRIVLGLLLAIFLGAIDQTIVSVALLSIARDLDGIALIPWVVAGYLVASTVATPIYGKLSDLRGRWPLLSVAIGISFVASALCALAQSMPQLIAFRILQGLGGGGLLALAQATVADIAPGPQRGRYQGYISGMFAVAAVLGPVLGGYLTHYFSWRAIFVANLPIAAAAFLVARRALAKLPVGGRKHEIDWPGALLLAGGLCALLVALTRLGQGAGWTAPSTLGLLGASALLLALCALRERVAREPILPPELFRNRTFVLCCATMIFVFFALIGSSVMLPLWMQSVAGAGPDEVALRMIPLTLAIPAGAFASGRLMLKVHGLPLRAHVAGGAGLASLAAAGIALLADGPSPLLAPLMTALGVGLGLTMPATIVTVQTSVSSRQVGVATATNALFRTLGGAVGIAILTSVLFAALHPGAHDAPAAAGMLEALRGGESERLAGAFRTVFATIACMALGAAATALALPRAGLEASRQPPRS